MKKINLILFMLLIMNSTFSQTNSRKRSKTPEWTGTIEQQFNEVFAKSGKYQDYKVIKAFWFQKLKKNTLDTIYSFRKNIKNLQANIDNLQTQIKGFQVEINNKNSQINQLQGQKDNIKFFGTQISKNTYNLLLWSIISVFALLLVFFIYKFYNSNNITKETLENYRDLSNEYQSFRTLSLEREQSLQRKLLDEINKNENNN